MAGRPRLVSCPVDRASGLRQIHVLAGRFEVGEDPGDSSLRIDLDDSTLIAAAVRVSPGPQRDVGVAVRGTRPRTPNGATRSP